MKTHNWKYATWRYAAAAVVFLATTLNVQAVKIAEHKLRVSGKAVFYFDAYISKKRLKTIKGRIRRITGTINLKTRDIEITVPLTKASTSHRGRDERMHEEVIESARFARAVFSGKIKKYDPDSGRAEAAGTLDFHGIRRSNVKIFGRIKKTPEGYKLIATFPLLLTDHGIKVPSSYAVLKVGNEVKVKAILRLTGAD